jgi:hypothetical protein
MMPEPPPSEPAAASIVNEFQILIGFGLGLAVTGGAGYFLSRNERYSTLRLVRCILWGLLGALIAYNYYALNLPGTDLLTPLGAWGGLLVTVFGGAAGLLLYRLRAS